ncbi:hypothetical protein LP419_31265 [Massilia sp. H-1]|nr:hypothetical protein LP419_31265 [Massilia sp. H-1]
MSQASWCATKCSASSIWWLSIGWESDTCGLSFVVPEEDLLRVRHHFAEHGISAQQRIVVMHPGAERSCAPLSAGALGRGHRRAVAARRLHHRPDRRTA